MTALYRPVLIESAEQAEALPIGTVATHDKGSGMDHAHKLFPPLGHTESLLWASLTGLVSNAGMVGWTALVPIEAEEERVERIKYSPRGYETNVYSETRLVTPWEDA